jgi:quercetin dioxygenase-like cupin family protein
MATYRDSRSILFSSIAIIPALLAAPAHAVEASKNYPIVPLVKGNRTIMGEEFNYPKGQPNVTAAILTLLPGARTLSHKHGVPTFIYVLEGEIEVDYGAKGKRIYKKGDAFLEAMSVAHYGMNNSTAPVRILAVYMGAAGADDMIPAQ